MKKINQYLVILILIGAFGLSSFTVSNSIKASSKLQSKITGYAWYDTSGQFVTYGNLVSVEVVSGDNTNSKNGTLALLGYTCGGPNQPPSGTLVYKLYSHP